MVWGSFAAAGLGQLPIIDSNVDLTMNQSVLKENVSSFKAEAGCCNMIMTQHKQVKYWPRTKERKLVGQVKDKFISLRGDFNMQETLKKHSQRRVKSGVNFYQTDVSDKMGSD